jgi:hypothetical protein
LSSLPETGLKSLNRTKRLMKLQNVAMAAAIFFSLAPFSFFFEEGRISFLLLRDAPTVAGA